MISIHNKENTEDDEGVYIFNGKKVVNLQNKVVFRHIPSTFTIEEFGTKYWENCILDNSVIWFTPSKYKFNKYKSVGYNAFTVKDGKYLFVIGHHEKSKPKDLIKIIKSKKVLNGDHNSGTLEYIYKSNMNEFDEEDDNTVFITFDKNNKII